MKRISKLIWVIVTILLIICIFLIARTVLHKFPTIKKYQQPNTVYVPNFNKYVDNLSGGLQIATISNTDYNATDFAPFVQFRDYVQSTYPLVFKNAEYTVVNGHAMLIKWPGRRSDLKPILFNAHYDVVPPEQEELWKYGPFSGTVADGRIYGRGALDMKGMLFSLLSAADNLMSSEFVPERDVYFAFGHDEEVGAAQGSSKIAQYLHDQGIKLDAAFDEGGMIALANMGGNEYGFAFVGIAEKGLTTVKINVFAQGGHSSMPPQNTALGDAAVIMQRLQDNQMPARLLPVTDDLLNTVGGILKFPVRVLIANKSLFSGIVLDQLSKIPAANAMIRTTTALTQASGSDAYNVLPSVASIVVNFRILPGDTIDDVIAHVQKLCDGYDVKLDIMPGRNPSRVSSISSAAYENVHHSILNVYPTATIIPYITLGGTDSRNYEPIADNVYRFLPAAVTSTERGLMHNYDESISLENYNRMILYFQDLIRSYDQ